MSANNNITVYTVKVYEATGTKEWFVDGKRHRTDGPAFECTDGYKEWYIDGKNYSEAEFAKRRQQNDCPQEVTLNGVVYVVKV